MTLRAHVQNRYREEAVDLQPYGNTISVEAPSDNPFESNADVEIYTQASGGMAGPDARMRSRGTLVQRPRTTKHQGGRSKAFHVTMDAAHAGFMPGLGEIRRGFMPGLGASEKNPYLDAITGTVGAAGGALKDIYGAKSETARARAAEATAAAERERTTQQGILARMGSNAGAHPLITYGLVAVAVAAIGFAVFKSRK